MHWEFAHLSNPPMPKPIRHRKRRARTNLRACVAWAAEAFFQLHLWHGYTLEIQHAISSVLRKTIGFTVHHMMANKGIPSEIVIII